MSNQLIRKPLFGISKKPDNLNTNNSSNKTDNTQSTNSTSWLNNSSYSTTPTSNNEPTTIYQKKKASDFFTFEDDSTSSIVQPILNINKVDEKSKLIIATTGSGSKKRKEFISDSESSESSSDEEERYRKHKKLKTKSKSKDIIVRDKKSSYTDKDRDLIISKLFSNASDKSFEYDYRGYGSSSNPIISGINHYPNNNRILGLERYQMKFTKKDGITISFIENNKVTERYFSLKSKNQLLSNPIVTISQPINQKQYTNGYIPLVNDTNTNTTTGEENDDNVSVENEILIENSKLNNRVEKEPNNIKYWIDLAEYQDKLLMFSQRKQKARMAILEKKLEIYRSALVYNPSSEELTIRYLSIANRLWEPKQVQRLWEKVIEKSSNEMLSNNNNTKSVFMSEKLWNSYTEFCCSNFTLFKVSTFRSIQLNILRNLLAKRRTLKVKDKEFQNNVKIIEESIIRFLAQWARFESQAGFTERAVTIYQALIEFNCFLPIHLQSQPHAILLRDFKKFWELFSPRFGDENSKGWAFTLSDNQSEDLDMLSIEEMERLLKESDDDGNTGREQQEQQFFNITHQSRDDGNTIDEDETKGLSESSNMEEESELLCNNMDCQSEEMDKGLLEERNSELFWLPGNVEDDIGGDSERIILFEDFKDILFKLVCEGNKLELIYQFLEFLGIPLHLIYSIPRFNYNHLLRKESYQNIIDNNISSLFKNLNNSSGTTNEQNQVQPNWLETFQNAFKPKEISSEKIGFIERIFEQSLKVFPREIKLIQYYIVFKSTRSLENAKEKCKYYLSKLRDQYSLYDLYAQLELQHSNNQTTTKPLQELKKIYQMTLSTKINNQNDANYLYKQYFKVEFDLICKRLENNKSILSKFIKQGGTHLDILAIPIHILCCHAENNYQLYPSQQFTTSPTNPTRLQNVKNIYQANCHKSNYSYLLCYSLFLIMIGESTLAIRDIFNNLDKEFSISINSIDHELFVIEFLEVLIRYSSIFNQPSPSIVKTITMKSLKEFNYYDHPYILSLFFNLESKNSIVSEVRLYIDFTIQTLQDQNIDVSQIFWLFNIRSEIFRLGSGNRIKSQFEKALKDSCIGSSKHSIILWRLYILFELSRNRPKTTKSLYYRSIKELPWAKSIWMLPFINKHLGTLFTNQELIDLISLMKEKGIRLRVLE